MAMMRSCWSYRTLNMLGWCNFLGFEWRGEKVLLRTSVGFVGGLVRGCRAVACNFTTIFGGRGFNPTGARFSAWTWRLGRGCGLLVGILMTRASPISSWDVWMWSMVPPKSFPFIATTSHVGRCVAAGWPFFAAQKRRLNSFEGKRQLKIRFNRGWGRGTPKSWLSRSITRAAATLSKSRVARRSIRIHAMY